MINKRKLKAKRCERSITQKEIAEAMNMSTKTYNFKENGKVDFTNSEINILKDFLSLSIKDVEEIFLQK